MANASTFVNSWRDAKQMGGARWQDGRTNVISLSSPGFLDELDVREVIVDNVCQVLQPLSLFVHEL